MKKVFKLIIYIALISVLLTNNVYAINYDDNKQYIIDTLNSKAYEVNVDGKIVNQIKNYLMNDEVSINASQARYFVKKYAIARKAEISAKTEKEKKDVWVKYNDAYGALGLNYAYDSANRKSYYIDTMGHIIIDESVPIKSTGEDIKFIKKSFPESYGFFLAAIISLLVIFIIVRISANKKIKMYAKATYEPIEQGEKPGKSRPRNYSLGYFKLIQILKYFYYPVILAGVFYILIFGLIKYNSDNAFLSSVENHFMNNQPLYIQDDSKFEPVFNNANEKIILQKDVKMPFNGQQYAILKSEKNNINVPVYFGDRYEYFEKGAGTYAGSELPGFKGVTLIGAHNTTYFKNLENVNKGQSFVINTTYGAYTYEVINKFILDGEEVDKAYSLEKTDKERVVLYTCYPFKKFEGNKNQRMFIILEKKSGPEIYLGE